MMEKFRKAREQKKKTQKNENTDDDIDENDDHGSDDKNNTNEEGKADEETGWGLKEGEVFNAETSAAMSSDEDNLSDDPDDIEVEPTGQDDDEDDLSLPGDDDDVDDDHITSSAHKKNKMEKIQENAEILALAKKLKDKKTRSEVIDMSYNRYAFNDSNMPEWFLDDEKKHSRPNLPITKAEVDEMKKRFNEINSRAIKKVAEAKARKKKKLARTMERTKVKAEGILANTEVAEKDKMREIEKLYKTRHTKAKVSKTYVVTRTLGSSKHVGDKKKGKGKVEKRTRFVDKRLKMDKRAAKAKAKRVGKAGKGKPKPKGKVPKRKT